MTVEFSNCWMYFLTLTAVSSLSVLATGAILGFLLIEWENRFLEHFVKPVLLGILILLISAWHLHRPERAVELATRDRISLFRPNQWTLR